MKRSLFTGVLISLFGLIGCGGHPVPHTSLSQPVSLARLAVWDAQSISFSSSPMGGESPIANRGPLMGPPQPGDQLCTLNSKTYNYQQNTHTLEITICDNIQQDPRRITVVLDQRKQAELSQILSNVVSHLRPHTGEPIPGCGSIIDSKNWFEVHRNDNSTRTFYIGANPRGDSSPRFSYGTLTDFNFLNQIEALLND